MAVNKVIYNTEDGAQTLIDLTGDTVTPNTLAKGITAHDASGNTITGTMQASSTGDTLTWDGNTEGLVSVGDMFYYISGATPSLEDLLQATCTCTIEGEDITFIPGDVASALFEGIIHCEAFLVVYENAVGKDVGGAAFEKAGVYAVKVDSLTLTIPGYTGFRDVVIKEYIEDDFGKRGLLMPVFANSIADCTNINRSYFLPDGYLYEYGPPINFLNSAVDDNGNIYEGKGYGAYSDGGYITGWIPIKEGDVVRLWNMPYASSSSAYVEFSSGLTDGTIKTFNDISLYFNGIHFTGGYKFELTSYQNQGYNYFRVYSTSIDSSSYITINAGNRITESWRNSGKRFVPADYERRISALENSVSRYYENVTPTLQTSWGSWTVGNGEYHLSPIKAKYKYRTTAVLNLDDWFNQNADKCIIEAYLSYYDQFTIGGDIAPIIELTGQKVSGQPSVYLFSSNEEPDADVDYPPTYKWIRVTKVR